MRERGRYALGTDDDDESAARDSDEDSAPDPALPAASDSDSMDGL